MVVGGTSLAVQLVKNLPEIQETQVWSLDGEDLLGKRMEVGAQIMEQAFLSQDSRMSNEAHGLTDHTGHLILMIIKHFLVTAKPLTAEKWPSAQFSPGSGRG